MIGWQADSAMNVSWCTLPIEDRRRPQPRPRWSPPSLPRPGPSWAVLPGGARAPDWPGRPQLQHHSPPPTLEAAAVLGTQHPPILGGLHTILITCWLRTPHTGSLQHPAVQHSTGGCRSWSVENYTTTPVFCLCFINTLALWCLTQAWASRLPVPLWVVDGAPPQLLEGGTGWKEYNNCYRVSSKTVSTCLVICSFVGFYSCIFQKLKVATLTSIISAKVKGGNFDLNYLSYF